MTVCDRVTRVERIRMGLALMFDGLVAVATLGSIAPSTAMTLAGRLMRNRIARLEREEASR